MNSYLPKKLASVVSLDLETSWAAKALREAIIQEEFNSRFQQKQLQEKEEKLLRLYENQQQRAFDKVNRGSAGSNGSLTTTTTIQTGKVRQLFDERRQKAGIDKSYPLEPLRTTRSNGLPKRPSLDSNKNSRTVLRTTVQKSVSRVENGKPVVKKKQVVQGIYNNDCGKESYDEEIYEEKNGNEVYFNSPERDLVAMMNNHNLGISLDDEEMPSLPCDDIDEGYTPKLMNAEMKFPMASEVAKKTTPKSNGTTLTRKPAAVPKRETKPSVKSVIKKNTASSARPSPPTISASTSRSSSLGRTPRTPVKMSSSQAARAPSSNRPSGKQTPRGPQSAVTRDDLVECKYCNRRFAEDRLRVHEDICAKTGKKKRRTYDALKHRVQGTELEPFVRKGGRPSKGAAPPPKKPANRPETITRQPNQQQAKGKKDWRRQHEEFISAIRAAKMAQAHIAKGGKLSDLPPPPPSTNPDYVQCPHCHRRFNETAAERHIPKCATYEYNKPKNQSSMGARSFQR